MLETQIPSLGQEDPLEKEIATHSNILAWEIPWTKEPHTHTHTHTLINTKTIYCMTPFISNVKDRFIKIEIRLVVTRA